MTSDLRPAVFDDAWAYRALASASDAAHGVARVLNERLRRAGFARITSNFVIDEALTGIRSDAGHDAAVDFARRLLAVVSAGGLRVVTVDPTIERGAMLWFERLDGELPRLSFTDCTSFAIMTAQRVRLAFTADRHFDLTGTGIAALVERRKRGYRIRDEMVRT